MSLFELPVDDYQEPETVPEGEYELQIYSAEERTAQSGRSMIACQIRILNAPSQVLNASTVWHNLLGVMTNDPPNTRNAMLGNGKAFCQVFDINPPINVLELPGRTGKCLLILEEDQNGVPRNVLKLPRPKGKLPF